MAVKGPNRSAKGDGSVYFRQSDQRWCGTLTLPSPDGKRRRKTVTAKTEAAAKKKLKDLRRELAEHGDLPTTTQTVESWLNIWYDTIATKKIRPKTARTYRSLLERHIIPTIGKTQLTKLTPEHVRRVSAAVHEKGLSSTTALQCHRILSGALTYALREGRVSRNVAELTDAPRRARKQLAVLTAADGVKVLHTVASERLGSRWAAALLTGARRGELLGLELSRVTDHLDLSWQLQRISWEHGCKSGCGAKRGTECPQRKVTFPDGSEHRYLEGGLWLVRPKSHAGTRIIPLVDPLRTIIERRAAVAMTETNPHGLLWTADPKTGAPIDPDQDSKAWHKVLKRAGVDDARLHDARHTTASLLLEAEVPEALIVKILGHSSYAMTRSYQHVDGRQLETALKRMSALMIEPPADVR